eukprot:9191515-Pyramimonas_sp.AAC.1
MRRRKRSSKGKDDGGGGGGRASPSPDVTSPCFPDVSTQGVLDPILGDGFSSGPAPDGSLGPKRASRAPDFGNL